MDFKILTLVIRPFAQMIGVYHSFGQKKGGGGHASRTTGSVRGLASLTTGFVWGLASLTTGLSEVTVLFESV